ncbi:beta-N-acetylhexosaminidase [Ketobacter sp. MCCC 1A13808]|uniref:beta-N-acetylhexosaminidase n=1 Tax=Ketobacter sp. MCCC 1A13808 TaxID=2602738 RepID=UPI0012EC6205|nr:beta-N-acetylhexosaminidase [Ketobacter sp. MCCC 1A13808]MVF12690.1 beta-N-acetylhexosaminidase [Ketobacter sp. MCCC 1A13808]
MAIGPLMLDLEGTSLCQADIRRLQHPATGGVILFSRNIDSLAQTRELIAAVRQLRPELILAIDQEGGRVQRIREGVTRLPPLARLGEQYQQNPDAALMQAANWGWLMASEMLALGLDISFAPVLDLECGRSAVIGDRSFHHSADTVTALAKAYISGMHDAGMAATVKHFPGHGWAEADSHVAIPLDERDELEIDALDMIPFKQLCGVYDAVMPAHVIYSRVDPQPAGFSSYWLQTVLRQRLGFNGVIFSDDLTMEGASVAGGFAQRAKRALDAGCDMVLVCNHHQGADEVLDFLAQDSRYVADQTRLKTMLARRMNTWEQLLADDRYGQIQLGMQTIA